MIKVLIADNSEIICAGINAMLTNHPKISVIGICSTLNQVKTNIRLFKPDVLIMDVAALQCSANDLKLFSSQTSILGISNFTSVQQIQSALNNNVKSYLLKECDKQEVIDAIISTSMNETFLCGKIVEAMISPSEVINIKNSVNGFSCKGFGITERELEIIIEIAQGLSNKQIADKLFLSPHTIITHRKNIMGKLGVKNSAGVVMFAVNNGLVCQN